MNLIDRLSTPCVLMKETIVPNGIGGNITNYVADKEFMASIIKDNSMLAKIGQQIGVKSTYTITIPENMSLYFHNVIKRLSDGKMFRITSDSDDINIPDGSNIRIKWVAAEDFKYE